LMSGNNWKLWKINVKALSNICDNPITFSIDNPKGSNYSHHLFPSIYCDDDLCE
jgi:hypothetical protein